MVLSSFRDPGQGKWLDNQSGRAEATSGWVTIDKRECVIGKHIQSSLLYRMFPHGRQGGHNGVPKNETAAILELQYSPVAVELWFWYANVFLFSNKFVKMLATWVKTPYSILVSHTFELFFWRCSDSRPWAFHYAANSFWVTWYDGEGLEWENVNCWCKLILPHMLIWIN